MGDSAHGGFAVFCHKDLNTTTDYALIQSGGTSAYTYLNCRSGGQLVFRQNNSDRMRIRDNGNYNMLELHPPSSSKSCKIRMKHGNGNYWDMIAPANEFYFQYNGSNKCIIFTNGNVRAYRDFDAPNGQLYTKNAFVGVSAYGDVFACFARKGFESGAGRYAMLQDNGGNTYLNGLSNVYFRINNQQYMYMNSGGVYTSNNARVNSDDRLKYQEEDILGLNIIRQLKPKKYKKIKLPFVKKRRRYYDENDITIIDDYIEDICMNGVNDLSFNEYYDDDDYIHKEIIEEEDVDEFVSEEDISNGQVEVGLIAQDVLETDISFVVHKQEIIEDMNGKPLFQPYAVEYGSVMPYCIQAIKELDVIV